MKSKEAKGGILRLCNQDRITTVTTSQRTHNLSFLMIQKTQSFIKKHTPLPYQDTKSFLKFKFYFIWPDIYHLHDLQILEWSHFISLFICIPIFSIKDYI